MGGVRPFLLGKPCDENPQYNRFWDGHVMRARNIKPGFFKNEDLCDLEPIDRLLFAGLWLLADREGRLEDRPKRIRLELFPLDNYDVNQGLDRLHAAGFISRYVIETQAIVQISNFDKHQSPHGTEKDSELPDENGFLTVHERGKSGQVTGAKRLINVKERESIVNKRPDSLNPDSLNPDSLNPELATTPLDGSEKPGADKSSEKTKPGKSIDPLFSKFWMAYPRKTAKAEAQKAFAKIKPDEQVISVMLNALSWQTRSVDWTKDGGRYIPHAATWLNQRRWEDEPTHLTQQSRHSGFSQRDYHAGVRDDGKF